MGGTQGPTELCLFWVNGLTWIGSGGSVLKPVCLEKPMQEIKRKEGVFSEGGTLWCLDSVSRETKRGYFQL